MLSTEHLIASARMRLLRDGLPEPLPNVERVAVGWHNGALHWCPAGLWIDLCEAVQNADHVRDGGDLDRFADYDRLVTFNPERIRGDILDNLDAHVTDAAEAMIAAALAEPVR